MATQEKPTAYLEEESGATKRESEGASTERVARMKQRASAMMEMRRGEEPDQAPRMLGVPTTLLRVWDGKLKLI